GGGRPGNSVNKSSARFSNGLESAIRTCGRCQKNRAEVVRVHLLSILTGFFHSQISDESTINACLHRFRTKTFRPKTQHWIQISEHDQPNVRLLTDLLG